MNVSVKPAVKPAVVIMTVMTLVVVAILAGLIWMAATGSERDRSNGVTITSST